ncbi:helix-turn-helix transcriptional regulator [Mycobacteroides abscessus]
MDLIGVDELASMIGVSASTVRWWKQTGKGPRSAKIGKHVKYRRKDVEAWVESLFEAQPEPKMVDYELKPLGRRRIASAGHE